VSLNVTGTNNRKMYSFHVMVVVVIFLMECRKEFYALACLKCRQQIRPVKGNADFQKPLEYMEVVSV